MPALRSRNANYHRRRKSSTRSLFKLRCSTKGSPPRQTSCFASLQMKNPAALLAVLGTSDRGGLSPNACRVKGFSNVESNAGVERLVRVIAADRAAGVGSAKGRRAPPHALGGARLGKPDRSAPHGDRESSGARRSANRRGHRRH